MADDKQLTEKKVIVPKTAAEIQRFKVEKLMKKADKDVFIPEASEKKLPRVFNPPEFIRNVWGSSAGAGSGDFHVYRGVRRREYARQKFNNEMAKQDEKDEKFMAKMDVNKKSAEEKTSKKRAKRLKKKQKQQEKRQKTDDSQNKSQDDDSEEEES